MICLICQSAISASAYIRYFSISANCELFQILNNHSSFDYANKPMNSSLFCPTEKYTVCIFYFRICQLLTGAFKVKYIKECNMQLKLYNKNNNYVLQSTVYKQKLMQKSNNQISQLYKQIHFSFIVISIIKNNLYIVTKTRKFICVPFLQKVIDNYKNKW